MRGIKIARTAPPISHLMFADDLLLFGVANEKEATNIKASLDLYCTWSRQAINFEKSAIQFSSKTGADQKNIVLHKLMVKTLDKHDRYLGNPLLLPKSKAEAFSLLYKMKGIMRDFWWGFENGRKNIYLRSWDQICKPTNLGGLSIRRLDAVNQVLVAKLAWRMLVEPNNLWAKTLKAKYFRNSSFWNAAGKQSKSWFWSSIMQVRNWGITHVNHLIEAGSWKEELVRTIFPENIASTILNFKVGPAASTSPDKLIWKFTTSGTFSAKSLLQASP
ncbi:uncharacterized protein [Typha latifolia]|uniref:uncharacterized protein n=1 Tax=Typha latifolia TaxID=4733 RepID=UPI003C30CFAE